MGISLEHDLHTAALSASRPGMAAPVRPNCGPSLALAIFIVAVLAFLAAPPTAKAAPPDAATILTMDLEGPITPAAADLLDEAIGSASQMSARLLVVRLDTPGGLLESARRMVRALLNAPLPVAVWVGPDGAHAASAGVFLVAASHVAAMAPATTMGAASPVSLGGDDMDDTMARKVQNDILGLLRSITHERNRNTQWYASSVTDAATVDAQQAVLNRVVEYSATDIPDLLQQIGARGVPFNGKVVRINADTAQITVHDPGLRYRFLSWLLHPQVAYLLFLGGLAGLFFELTSPGAVLPGVMGGLCLLLGLYALSVLPTTAAGILLILFGLVLFLLEIKIISHGLLSVAGIVALFVGSMILFQRSPDGFSLSLWTIVVTVGGTAALVGAAVVLAGRAQFRKQGTGLSTMLGKRASVRNWSGTQGRVLVQGVLWNARSETPLEVAAGDEVTIVHTQGLMLTVAQPGTPGDSDAHGGPTGSEPANNEPSDD